LRERNAKVGVEEEDAEAFVTKVAHETNLENACMLIFNSKNEKIRCTAPKKPEPERII
jgi:hypothetical protein